jgi:hypothetical protein
MTGLSERARQLAAEVVDERKKTKLPLGGVHGSEGASRWELLSALEVAYELIANLAEKVEALERDR